MGGSITAKPPLVLVVEDDRGQRLLIRHAMEAEGYRVSEAKNGKECLEVVTTLDPDLILMDAIMPVMDGFACCTQLKTNPCCQNTPILMVTSLDDQHSVDQAFMAGATDYITKPIHWAVLRQRINRLLQASQTLKQLQSLNLELEQKVRDRTAQLADQVKELQRLDVLKSNFLSTVSHELRTPLTNIRMATEMLGTVLSAKGIHTEPKIERYLGILQSEIDREMRVVNDLLDLQRLENEGDRPSLHPLDLPAWLPILMRPFQERCSTQQQELLLKFLHPIPRIVSSPTILEQVLMELLNNACKYTPPLERIVLSVWLTDRVLFMEICNTGIEIPEHELPHVFEKFYRVPSQDPWRQGGTGLGLALAQKRVELLGGSIRVTSHSGQTSFTIELPLI